MVTDIVALIVVRKLPMTTKIHHYLAALLCLAIMAYGQWHLCKLFVWAWLRFPTFFLSGLISSRCHFIGLTLLGCRRRERRYVLIFFFSVCVALLPNTAWCQR